MHTLYPLWLNSIYMSKNLVLQNNLLHLEHHICEFETRNILKTLILKHQNCNCGRQMKTTETLLLNWKPELLLPRNSVNLQCQDSVSVLYFTWHTNALWDWNVDMHSYYALYSETKSSKILSIRVMLAIQNAKPKLPKGFYSNS